MPKNLELFISYRRTYQEEGDGIRITEQLVDFLEKQTYFVNGEKQRTYKVFWDQNSMGGKAGEFTPIIKHAIRNSEYFLLLLGPKAFDRPFKKDDKDDVFYQEILTALEKDYEKDTFVICMDGFVTPEGFENYPPELQKVAKKYQWLGGKDGWKEEEMEELKSTLLNELTKHRAEKLDKM